MFRKPKKTSKAKFRSRKPSQTTKTNNQENDNINLESSNEDTINNNQNIASRGRKRFRVSTADTSSDDDDNDNDNDGSTSNEPIDRESQSANDEPRLTTSELIQQSKKDQKEQSSSSRFSSSAAKDGRRRRCIRVLHQFESSDPSKELTAKDLATRSAQFHPKDRPTATNDAPNDNDDATNDNNNTDGSKIYKGENAVRNKFLAGPLKAPTFVRTTSRFDYQPDICKDYKDTGFCGYGDTCIYLHDRGDTMSGWQLEAEWKRKKKAEQEKKEAEMESFARGEVYVGGSDDGGIGVGGKEDDGLPFACYLCRGPFCDPIVSRCGHYFCKNCIIQNERVNGGSCPICKKDTQGVFNQPIKLIAKKRRVLGSRSTWEEYADAMSKK